MSQRAVAITLLCLAAAAVCTDVSRLTAPQGDRYVNYMRFWPSDFRAGLEGTRALVAGLDPYRQAVPGAVASDHFVVDGAPTPARADTSVDTRAQPHTPFGRACDAALAAAQVTFRDGWRDIDFHVRGQAVVGAFRWSDMCGVFGDYTLALARDLRPPARWRWSERRDQGGVHRRGVVRAGGLRASFILDADDASDLSDAFVAAFQPAVDVCLATSAERGRATSAAR